MEDDAVAIRAGGRILGVAEVEAPLPPLGELARWSAREVTTGATVEVVTPITLATLRPGARELFAAAQALPSHPAVLQVRAAGTHEGKPVAVRDAVAGGWPEGQRLTPEQVRLASAWLGPAVVQAATALGGALDPTDLVVAADGRVLLAPSGVVRGGSIAQAQRHRPPERSAEGPAGALYGLGVVLFEALTGQPPAPGRTPTQVLAAQQAPLRARDLVAGLPADVDALLAGLLSPDPADRLAAVPQATGEALVIDLPAPAAPPVARASTTRTGMARRDLPLPAFAVVARPAGLTRAARRRLAALVDVPVEALDQAARQGLVVPVAGAPTRAGARARANALAVATDDLAVVRTGLPLPTLGGLIASALLLALAGVVGLLSVAGTVLGLALLASAALLGTLAVLRAGRATADSRHLREGQHLLAAAPQQAPASVTRARAMLSSTRRALLEADLANAVRHDLLAATDDLEDELEGLSAAPESIEAEVEAIIDSARLLAEVTSGPSTQGATDRARHVVARANATRKELGS